MNNMPKTKIGIVAVSRDCFPESLSVTRREALIKAYKEKYDPEDIYECPVCIVESEIHMVKALEDIKKAGCDAFILETLDQKSQKHFLQNTLMDQRCLWQQLRKVVITS